MNAVVRVNSLIVQNLTDEVADQNGVSHMPVPFNSGVTKESI